MSKLLLNKKKGDAFLSSGKKNYSSCRCKSRLKPCDVVPVSKVLKAIDVCEIPKCDCSGSVNLQTADSKVIVNICPNCILQDSLVSIGFLNTTFNSTVVNLPQCISTDAGTILQVTGFGIITFDLLVAQGAFMLQLLENFVGDDQLLFSASGFDQGGNSITISSSQTVPDEALLVSFCTSGCSPCQGIKNKTSKPFKLGKEINKGSLVIIKNGEIEVKEL
ncbi:hypothetical protein ACIQZG_19195 [Lysinibacillus sp. NPDC096418]|uniref:hypothetical protein n=1 Tax=Lysinibacillus sp. NPDC096418 TaxID=3364138 RepID=UPI00380B2D18